MWVVSPTGSDKFDHLLRCISASHHVLDIYCSFWLLQCTDLQNIAITCAFRAAIHSAAACFIHSVRGDAGHIALAPSRLWRYDCISGVWPRSWQTWMACESQYCTKNPMAQRLLTMLSMLIYVCTKACRQTAGIWKQVGNVLGSFLFMNKLIDTLLRWYKYVSLLIALLSCMFTFFDTACNWWVTLAHLPENTTQAPEITGQPASAVKSVLWRHPDEAPHLSCSVRWPIH